MLVMSEDAKNLGWLKMWSMYVYAFIVAFPQIAPLISPELQESLPGWFKATLSIAGVVGMVVRVIKQDGILPAKA